MSTESHETNKDHIVNYLMVNFSKKAVKASKFCEATGLDAASMSNIKNERNHHKVSANAWGYLEGIYDNKAFDKVMNGEYDRFVPQFASNRSKTKVDQKPKEDTVTETPYQKHQREERERFEAMKETPDLKDMKVKELSKTAVVERKKPTKVGPLYGILSPSGKLSPKINPEIAELHESEITVGMAIDTLIKAGAKISISLEV